MFFFGNLKLQVPKETLVIAAKGGRRSQDIEIILLGAYDIQPFLKQLFIETCFFVLEVFSS